MTVIDLDLPYVLTATQTEGPESGVSHTVGCYATEAELEAAYGDLLALPSVAAGHVRLVGWDEREGGPLVNSQHGTWTERVSDLGFTTLTIRETHLHDADLTVDQDARRPDMAHWTVRGIGWSRSGTSIGMRGAQRDAERVAADPNVRL